MVSSVPCKWEVTFGASLGSAAVEGSGISAELCVAVLNACGPIPAFSCSALHPAPAGCPVYSLLCGKWMSLPSLKCWCVARFPSFGLARSEQQRCRVQLCTTLRDLLLPGLLGSAEPAQVPEPTHRGFWRHLWGGEAQVQLCWRGAEDGLLLVGASCASSQGLRASCREGVGSGWNGVPVPACSGQPLDMRMWVLFKGTPWCAWQYRPSWTHRITTKGTQKSWTPSSEQTDLSTLPL